MYNTNYLGLPVADETDDMLSSLVYFQSAFGKLDELGKSSYSPDVPTGAYLIGYKCDDTDYSEDGSGLSQGWAKRSNAGNKLSAFLSDKDMDNTVDNRKMAWKSGYGLIHGRYQIKGFNADGKLRMTLAHSGFYYDIDADQKSEIYLGGYDTNGDGVIDSDDKSMLVMANNGKVTAQIDSINGIVLRSPNGTKFKLLVDNDGNLSTTSEVD